MKTVQEFFGPEYLVQSSANQPQVGEGVEDMKREQVMNLFLIEN